MSLRLAIQNLRRRALLLNEKLASVRCDEIEAALAEVRAELRKKNDSSGSRKERGSVNRIERSGIDRAVS